jgi:hypothetical protein
MPTALDLQQGCGQGREEWRRTWHKTSKMINTDIKSYQVLEIEMAGLLVVFGSDLWCDQMDRQNSGG